MDEASDDPRTRQTDAAGPVQGTISASLVAALYEEHGPELRRFVLGITRDPEAANDVIQTTFARAVALGHTARAEALKGWLFQVAYHEAITARRRQETRRQANGRLAALGFHQREGPDERLIRGETVEAVRQALDQLPPDQRRVVGARIYEDKSFAEIARELRLPLGTVLTRMRLAQEKLRRMLRPGE